MTDARSDVDAIIRGERIAADVIESLYVSPNALWLAFKSLDGEAAAERAFLRRVQKALEGVVTTSAPTSREERSSALGRSSTVEIVHA